MHAIIKIVLLILFNQAASADNRLVIDKNDAIDFKCKAVIDENAAKLYFLDEVNRYKQGLEWNKETTSAIEYSWVVFINEEYSVKSTMYNGIDLGVRYFSKNADKENGDLAKLFGLSEVSSFGYNEEGFIPIYIDRGELTIDIESKDVVLTLNRNTSTSFIFNNFPDNVHFWVIADGEIPRKCLAKVNKSADTRCKQ